MSKQKTHTLDLAQQTIRVADDVRFWPVRERGECVYRVEIPSLRRFFRIGYEEYVFVSLLDGETSIAQACGLAASRLGKRALSIQQSTAIVRWLLENELASLAASPSPIRQPGARPVDAPAGSAARSGVSTWIKRLNPFWIKFPLPGFHDRLESVMPLASPLASRGFVGGAVGVICSAALTLAFCWDEFWASSSEVFYPSSWCWWLGVWIGLKLVHELAHAVACHRQGGEVGEAGLVFILFAPIAYVDVTSCWRMPSRRARIYVSAAGMFAEWVIASLAMIAWSLSPDSVQWRFLMSNVIITAGLSTIIFNANVLMRFDGYFILADLIEVPNLAAEGNASLGRMIRRWLVGEDVADSNLMGWRRHFVVGYGTAAMVWRVMVCVSLAIAASTMFAGAGVVIAMLGILMWVLQPAKQLAAYSSRLKTTQPGLWVRGCVLGWTAVAAIAAMLLVVPIPTATYAPAIVQYQPETMVRAGCEGFVLRIHVADGDVVTKGDVLMELENRSVANRLEELELAHQQTEIRLRQAIEERNAGERMILREKQASLALQIVVVRDQVDSLRVVADRDGRVIGRHLDELVGTYVGEGDAIMVVATDRDKEVLAMVSQEGVEATDAIGDRPVILWTADGRPMNVRLDRIEPRATDRLIDPSLAAINGGPMAVKQSHQTDANDSVRLLEPHFRARFRLPDQGPIDVPAGMHGEAMLGYRNDPIAQRIRVSVAKLWNQADDDTSR
ncbi:biotin/lipoyl-binding protein [Rubripirellula reticaptiva]|uniref:HlyD family secretion protein n=1 Tax=Rubripirellula reticaptiva TaxID=2528013 RepID=A0A5C6ENP1_9BACT|nr:biotin/lipoyl-binding protein [Rubripirellula reticaptiva]TWU49216.1 HlyD family secretion protein [Rubripirellula reticaptiva]